MYKIILFFFFVVLGFTSCSKKFVNVDPKLEITVLGVDDRAISDVNVSLFETESDWRNKTNIIAKKVTATDGVVLFKNLNEQVYYFSAVKGELTNENTTVAINSNLKENIKAKIQIQIK